MEILVIGTQTGKLLERWGECALWLLCVCWWVNDVEYAHCYLNLPLSTHNMSTFYFISQALLHSSFSLNLISIFKVEVVKLYGLKAKCS